MTRLILVFIIALTSAYFGLQVISACDENTAHTCYDLHKEIISHTGDAPYRYRILAPEIIEIMDAQDDGHFLTSYFVFVVLQIALFFIGLYQWLKRWTDRNGALLGVALTALAFPLMYRWFYYAPYTILEAVLMVWALNLLAHSWHWSQSPVSIGKPDSC